MKKIIVRIFLAYLIFFVYGCFDIEETVTVKKDGSGNISLTAITSDSLVMDSLKESNKMLRVEGAKVKSKNLLKQKKFYHIEWIDFNKLSDISLADESLCIKSEKSIIGKSNAVFIHNMNIGKPSNSSDAYTSAILSDNYFSYILKIPGIIKKAYSINISDIDIEPTVANDTVEWNIPLSLLLNIHDESVSFKADFEGRFDLEKEICSIKPLKVDPSEIVKQSEQETSGIELNDLDTLRAEALEEAHEIEVKDKINALYGNTLSAAKSGDIEAAKRAKQELLDTYNILEQEYTLQIVSRSGTRSGVWRSPVNNETARNYYLIVEAISPNGQRVILPITSEEDGQVRMVSQWGLRVDPEVFERIKQDKMADGILNDKLVGKKQRGYLTPVYKVATTGAAITEW